MWMLDTPAKAASIAKETGVNFPSVMMHMIGLAKMGYIESPVKGQYVIAESGKKALGLADVGKEKATEIMGYLPLEKSFHFYADIGKPLNVYATSLGDFLDKIEKVDMASLEFHINRGDFETWLAALGDAELARKTLLIREQKSTGEELRRRLYQVVKSRCDALTRIRGAPPDPVAPSLKPA